MVGADVDFLLALAQLCYSAANPKAYVSVDSSVRLQQEVAKEGTNEAALLSVDEANGEAAQSIGRRRCGHPLLMVALLHACFLLLHLLLME